MNRSSIAPQAVNLSSDPQPQIEGDQHHSQNPTSDSVEIATLADKVRDFDLMTVAANLGLEPDRGDKHKWKGLGHIISINHGKFYDWLAEKGSGGAIDLVMHVRNCEFKEAVEWLSQSSLSAPIQRQPQQEIPKEPRPLELPVQHEKHWSNVRQYLIETRGLPAKLIDHLHTKGLIYADDRYNAVFLRYSDNSDGRNWLRHEPTGASLRGTSNQAHPFYGLAPGSSRENGWFWIGTGKGEVQRVLLTESPIDALSLATLEKKLRPQEAGVTIYLSTDGAGVIPTKDTVGETFRNNLGKP